MNELYDLYMEDYYKEALDEMNKYLGVEPKEEIFTEGILTPSFLAWYAAENNIDEDTYDSIMEENEKISANKDDVYKVNYYFRDHLQIPKVSKKLEKSSVRDQIIEFVGKFLDVHNDELSTSGPVKIFTFSDRETSFFYNLFEISGDELFEMYDNMVQETYYGKISKFITGWIKNAPHKILITAILIEALQKNYSEIIECCEYIWAFCEYPIVYREFWKTGVKEDLMNYTIEHLGNKFQVKKEKNLQGLLKYDAHSAVNAESERLKTGADHTYIDFMRRMRNQIKSKFRNIANAYFDNDKLNASQHSQSALFDDGSIADQDGHITNIARIVDNTINKYLSGGIVDSIVKVAAEGNKIDKDNLKGYLNQIHATKNNRIEKMLEDIITSYFNRNPTASEIIGIEFVNFGIALYRSLSNSKDPLFIEIRSILNYWMENIINIRSHYQNTGTIINYTRGIFNYFIFLIVHYN